MNLRPCQRRAGLTLLEVIVAMTIFGLSIIAIFQLLNLGSEQAMDVRLRMRTSLRCQSKLAEVIIGAQELSASGSYTYYEDADKDLQWKVEAMPLDNKGLLYSVKVWVKAEFPSGKIVESQLCQMVLNPSMRGSTFDQPKDPEQAMTPGQ